MELTLTRTEKTKDYTMGRLEIDGEHFCDTLEPTWRDLGPGRPGHKIAGRTAIPDGRYPVAVTWSPKFKNGFPCCSTCPSSRASASCRQHTRRHGGMHPRGPAREARQGARLAPLGTSPRAPTGLPPAGRRGVDQRRLTAYASSAHTQNFPHQHGKR